jgi:hypothetical protein
MIITFALQLRTFFDTFVTYIDDLIVVFVEGRWHVMRRMSCDIEVDMTSDVKWRALGYKGSSPSSFLPPSHPAFNQHHYRCILLNY